MILVSMNRGNKPSTNHKNKIPKTKTDAYSVGRTILKVWRKLRDDQQNQHPCDILQEIATEYEKQREVPIK